MTNTASHLAHYRYFHRESGEWRTASGGIPWCMSSVGTDEQHVVTDDEAQVTCIDCVAHLRFVQGRPLGWIPVDWFGEGE